MRSKYGLKALGLCAFLLGAMAVIASGAQAAEWDVAGANVGMLEPSVGLELESGTVGALLATINNLDMELVCTAGTLNNIKLLLNGTTSQGTARFTGCKANIADLSPPGTYTGVKLATACEPHSLGKPAGTIETREFTGTLELHTGSLPVVLVRPTNAAEEFAHLEMGEECSFGELISVYGVFTIQDCNGEMEVEKVKHLITEFAALTTLRVINKTTGPTAKIDGSAWTFLTGTHTGKNWRGLAG